MLQAQADNYGQNMRQRWRACYGQIMAAEGPRRGFVPQAQAA
jgi:hypothetical protein